MKREPEDTELPSAFRVAALYRADEDDEDERES
jgi:hypothetical protein